MKWPNFYQLFMSLSPACGVLGELLAGSARLCAGFSRDKCHLSVEQAVLSALFATVLKMFATWEKQPIAEKAYLCQKIVL